MPSTKTGRLILGKRGGRELPKYRAIPTSVDGIRFDSRREAERYQGLKILVRCGEIKNLRLQVPYDIVINGHKVCKYIADFVYIDNETGKEVVEDSKGMRTPVYRLKKKLMLAVHGITIVEV